MKNIIKSFVIVLAVAAIAGTASYSLFTDKAEVLGNTISAGTLDLSVDFVEGAQTKFEASDMVPGEGRTLGCVTLRNAGTIDGVLSLKVKNPVSNENGLYGPEADAGDLANTEIDTTGYDENDGTGELWDQLAMRFYIDHGAGSHATNKSWDWDDITLYSNYGTPGNDASSHYSIPLDSDLAEDNNFELSPEEDAVLCADAFFIDDQSNWWWGVMSGMSNNLAMSDSAMFDVEFGLTQAD